MRIAVVSGKGGVGKSTLVASLALALRATRRVGVADLDIEKPSIATILGAGDAEVSVRGDRFVPAVIRGIELMSSDLLFPSRAALLWSKRQEEEAAAQMVELTDWNCGILLYDSPPGTPPVLQSVFSRGLVDSAVLVTTPNPLDVDGAVRSLGLLQEHGVPALGVVFNRCSSGAPGRVEWRGSRGVKARLPVLGTIPEDPRVAERMVLDVGGLAERILRARPVPIPRETARRRAGRRIARMALKATSKILPRVSR